MVYSAKNIKIFKDLDAVKVRPGMYIGDLTTATKQMLYEILDNSIDELVCGHGSQVSITIDGDNYSVEDNGRGIPVDIHPTENVPAMELILTKLHTGGKFGNDNYKFSGGLHGVGASVVNALSSRFQCTVFKENHKYTMCFQEGKIVEPMTSEPCEHENGTTISYVPNFNIVEKYNIPYAHLEEKFKQLSYLNPGIIINLDYNGKKETFHCKNGIKDYLKILCPKLEFFIYDKKEFTLEDNQNVEYEIIVGWSKTSKCNTLSFCNNIYQQQGGTHFNSLKNGLFKVIKKYIEEVMNRKCSVIAEDIFISLQWIISIKIPEPQFASQTKEKLISKEGRHIVDHFVNEKIHKFFEENPKEAKEICKRVIENCRIRENSSQERNIIDKLENEQGYKLHSKLADCQSNDIRENELFIVEGDSAGGSAKMARDRKYQAILPLTGKLLNVERSTLDKTKSFKELIFLISAIGTGIMEKFNISKLRYGKIILMPDADIDGRHIAALLLNIFIKLTPQLIEEGRVYISRPPLYKIELGKKSIYVNDENELTSIIINNLQKKYNIQQDILSILESINSLLKTIHINKNNMQYEHIFHIPDNILMFYYVYGHKEFLSKMQLSGYKATMKDQTLYIENEYYTRYYTMTNIPDIPNNIADSLPLEINNEQLYDPMKIRSLFYEHGIKLQRYKGLGEMTAGQLRESCLDPVTRKIDLITMDHESSNTVKQVMGDQNRREFILSNLKELFNIDIDY